MATDEIKQIVVIEARLSQIESQLKKLESDFKGTFDRISNVANTALGALGVGISAGAIINFGKSVVDLGDKLSDLHDQTGLSIETLGGFRVAAQQNGIEIDDMATAILKAQKTLGQMDAEGDNAARTLRR